MRHEDKMRLYASLFRPTSAFDQDEIEVPDPPPQPQVSASSQQFKKIASLIEDAIIRIEDGNTEDIFDILDEALERAKANA